MIYETVVVVGLALIVVAIVGDKKIEVKEVKIGDLTNIQRSVIGVLGVTVLILGFWQPPSIGPLAPAPVIIPTHTPPPTITETPEPIPTSIPTLTQTSPVIPSPPPSPPPTITETPEPIPTSIPTETPISAPTPKPTDEIDQLPPIEWGIMKTYFDISGATLGKAEHTDVLGMVYEYDSINFIVEAKRSFYAITIFEAEFYDEDGIKVYSSFVEFDPNYDQWQAGDRSKGHAEIPSTSEMEKVRNIKISQFI